ncbi:glycosyltransferase family 22 protein [Polychaeton citri CBS 116435]|uniref:Mannosyltransferase n=1 Tax=Polychaeton citri CBS 116435 TaxID=1314669 RepID=A0A9P4UMR0_9PEZI|nr:glycosyltransferase family 22 protein [Polychaeton citri CBS 116435]
MWRRVYLLLALVRLYFALSPSYIHPDEHFQGPEVIAGEVFGWPVHKTWEFTSTAPIRSLFPLWLIYGWPLTVLKWIWEGLGYGDVSPMVVFYALRVMMFMLSFVLEDWALHELLPQRESRTATLLISSSYVTWTFQAHTFSNSIETLILLWCLVLIGRIRDDRESVQTTACVVLAFLGVLGIFNRITFPAFLVIPAAQLLPHLFYKPLRIPILALGIITALFFAIWTDTEFYNQSVIRFREFRALAVVTPLNNILYNLDDSNLAKHGLHPFWQHIAANLPQLIGPAFPLVIFFLRRNMLCWSALGGVFILSCIRHQEARFLLPAVPLLLASIRIPLGIRKYWIGLWIIFNIILGVLFGTYHQGGVVPAQAWITKQDNVKQVFWWKTYSPPTWLLNGKNLETTTIDLMGIHGSNMIDHIVASTSCGGSGNTLLVAPSANKYMASPSTDLGGVIDLQLVWNHRRHIGLDDLDFGDDGVWPTLQRVIGRRGLDVWQINRVCK